MEITFAASSFGFHLEPVVIHHVLNEILPVIAQRHILLHYLLDGLWDWFDIKGLDMLYLIIILYTLDALNKKL